jgi:DNA-binding response OmpR family regulator
VIDHEAPVLVVEDDDDVRKLVMTRLERLGFPVRGAATGEAGLESAQWEPPRLMLLDIYLPGIDGWEVLRRLRENEQLARTPVLVITVRDPDGGEPFEVDGYLVKPFRAAEMEAMVIRIMGSDGEDVS